MAQNPGYHGVLYKHSKLMEEIIGVFLQPEQKRRSFDNNRKEWWLAEQGKS